MHDESAASPVLLDHLPAEQGVITPPEHHDPVVHNAAVQPVSTEAPAFDQVPAPHAVLVPAPSQ